MLMKKTAPSGERAKEHRPRTFFFHSPKSQDEDVLLLPIDDMPVVVSANKGNEEDSEHGKDEQDSSAFQKEAEIPLLSIAN